jgi:hypothetical protein
MKAVNTRLATARLTRSRERIFHRRFAGGSFTAFMGCFTVVILSYCPTMEAIKVGSRSGGAKHEDMSPLGTPFEVKAGTTMLLTK